MTLMISAELAPLTINSDGVVRVAGTRVTFDTVVAVRQMNQARFDSQGLRDRLLAREVEQQQ